MKNIYLLYGINENMMLSKKKELIKSFNVDKNNISNYIYLDTNIDNIIIDSTTIGMFDKKKVIVIEDFINIINETDDIRDKFYTCLSNACDVCYILLVKKESIDTRKKLIKFIKEKGEIIECKKNTSNLVSFVNDYVSSNDYSIDFSNIKYFLNKVGSSKDNIINELDKLFMFSEDKKKIVKDDIDNIVVTTMEEDIFAFVDSVIKNNKSLSIKLYKDLLLKNEEVIKIIALLSRQYSLIYKVKVLKRENKSEKDITSFLKVHPYRVKKAYEHSFNFTEKQLITNIYMMEQLDEKIKTGKINKELGLEMFLINCL
ncbi:MAG: DNA polymerase III subunit delta [bacterium]|nr:DNA polymerase III subunit delta [bacterium]